MNDVRPHTSITGAVWLLAALAPACLIGAGQAPTTTSSAPATNLEYWLGEATTSPASACEPNAPASMPLTMTRPDESLPGAVATSDGNLLVGRIITTAGKDWRIWSDRQKRWRRIPMIAVLSITASVVEAKLEPQWRWKQMGAPERVYTGLSYPTRRLEWTFKLIDGSALTGPVKGQPLWVAMTDGSRAGPFVLHERQKGLPGQELSDLVHVSKVVISAKLAEHDSEAH